MLSFSGKKIIFEFTFTGAMMDALSVADTAKDVRPWNEELNAIVTQIDQMYKKVLVKK